MQAIAVHAYRPAVAVLTCVRGGVAFAGFADAYWRFLMTRLASIRSDRTLAVKSDGASAIISWIVMGSKSTSGVINLWFMRRSVSLISM